MVLFLRRFVIFIIGLILVAAPTIVREELWHYSARFYAPPDVPPLRLAATPIPTAAPIPVDEAATRDGADASGSRELRAGPVVLDLAHYNSVNPSSLQPLADALADRGLGLRYWLSNIDVMSITSYLDYPDQSEALDAQLADASALIVISPFFLWSSAEIALVEQFVADGGRLLLISDPDILGDYAAATNMLGEPFGVVFNEDYLYDTAVNDGNFTFFFQDAATPEGAPNEEAAALITDLTNATIAFYGGRSLSGDLQAVLRTVDTTLSSLRVGRNHFMTAGIGGVAARGTAGRVLALSDLDVLTEPYRQRHDNQQLVNYVADFMSADQRFNRVVDFPDYLGKQVSLAFGASAAINADLILQGAQIQHALEESGRTLTLRDASPLTGTLASTAPTNDLIYLAAYTTAISQTSLLNDLGIELYREVVTETVEIEPEPAPAGEEATSPEPSTDEQESSEASEAPNVEGTAEPSDDTVVPLLTPTPPVTITRPITATTPLTTTDEVTTTEQPTDELEAATNAEASVASTSSITAQQPPTATIESEANPVNDLLSVDRADRENTDDDRTDESIATPTPEATPNIEVRTVITDYLKLDSGLTFLADETVLIVHAQRTADGYKEHNADDGMAVLAVLAANNRGIDAGVNRLLTNDFSSCVIGELLSFCALADAGSDKSEGAASASGSNANTGSDESGSSGDTGSSEDGSPANPDAPTPPRGADAPILLIDDNRAAADGELSEADQYLQILLGGSYQVDLWSTSDQGIPGLDDLTGYGWVIWSNGGYAAGSIGGRDLDTIFSYINANGRITISSRTPLPGLEESAPLRDLVVDSAIAELASDLPSDAIPLVEDGGSAAVLNATAEEDEATQVVLRRGPASGSADSPVLVVLTDPSSAESEARLMIVAFAMTWVPDDAQRTLINNMASWMLAP